MKASRAAIKTAKAVAAMAEQMVAMDVQMGKMARSFERLTAKVATADKLHGEQIRDIETALLQLAATDSAEKPSTAAEALGKPGARKTRTTRKRGGA